MTLIINLFGQPCAGKSTTAAGAYSILKLRGVNVEYQQEFAKSLVYEERHVTMRCQPYIFAKQLKGMELLIGKVDVLITDSPLLLSSFYGKKYQSDKYPKSFFQFVEEQFVAMGGHNYFMKRTKGYLASGRSQTEEEADAIADELMSYLLQLGTPVTAMNGDELAPQYLADDIQRLLGSR